MRPEGDKIFGKENEPYWGLGEAKNFLVALLLSWVLKENKWKFPRHYVKRYKREETGKKATCIGIEVKPLCVSGELL